jgi:hypothetical protein
MQVCEVPFFDPRISIFKKYSTKSVQNTQVYTVELFLRVGNLKLIKLCRQLITLTFD